MNELFVSCLKATTGTDLSFNHVFDCNLSFISELLLWLIFHTDKEKPVAVNCPKYDILIATKKDKELVRLPNIQFTDNVAVKSIEYSQPNPVEINTGVQKPITVVARDDAGNMAYCRFEIHVDGKIIKTVIMYTQLNTIPTQQSKAKQ